MERSRMRKGRRCRRRRRIMNHFGRGERESRYSQREALTDISRDNNYAAARQSARPGKENGAAAVPYINML